MNGCIYRTEDNKCEFWSDHGKGIVSYCDFDDCEEKKPSNADRIRAMTDEELARFMWNCAQPCCPPINCAFKKCDAEKCWLKWLKEEANDE